MRNPKQILAVVLCLLLLANEPLFSQIDTMNHRQDSVQNEVLQNLAKQIQEFENARLQDSIKRSELEKELSSPDTREIAKKDKLLKEIDQIKNNDALRVVLKKQKTDSLRVLIKGYPVAPFFNDTLFLIYTKSGSFSPGIRAAAITNRIISLSNDYLFKSDSLKIIPGENTADIVYGELIIISISENDASFQNISKENLAEQYKTMIAAELIKYRKAMSWQTIAKEIGLAALVLFILGIIIFFVLKLFKFTARKIETQNGKRQVGVKIRNYELFDSKQRVNLILMANTLLKWLVVITVIYLALPILFSIFPWTKGFADTLVAYFLSPLKMVINRIWHYLPNLITIIVIVIVFRYFLKGIRYLTNEVDRGVLKLPGFYPDWAKPTFEIIRVLVYAFMLIVIFPYLPGSESPVFRGVSVFLGVVFTFGSSGSISNIVAGLLLTYMRAFKIGDRVNIGDATGDIIEKSLLITRIRTIKNEIISIPNSNVLSSHVTNFSSDAEGSGLIIHTTVTIGYDVPWRDMHRVLVEAALKTERILHEPEPFVLQTSLDDFYVSYQINAYTREPNKQALIYSYLHQNIQDCCFKAGIEIMSPHYQSIRDGNHSAIPDGFLPKDYIAPGFKVENADKAK